MGNRPRRARRGLEIVAERPETSTFVRLTQGAARRNGAHTVCRGGSQDIFRRAVGRTKAYLGDSLSTKVLLARLFYVTGADEGPVEPTTCCVRPSCRFGRKAVRRPMAGR